MWTVLKGEYQVSEKNGLQKGRPAFRTCIGVSTERWAEMRRKKIAEVDSRWSACPLMTLCVEAGGWIRSMKPLRYKLVGMELLTWREPTEIEKHSIRANTKGTLVITYPSFDFADEQTELQKVEIAFWGHTAKEEKHWNLNPGVLTPVHRPCQNILKIGWWQSITLRLVVVFKILLGKFTPANWLWSWGGMGDQVSSSEVLQRSPEGVTKSYTNQTLSLSEALNPESTNSRTGKLMKLNHHSGGKQASLSVKFSCVNPQSRLILAPGEPGFLCCCLFTFSSIFEWSLVTHTSLFCYYIFFNLFAYHNRAHFFCLWAKNLNSCFASKNTNISGHEIRN